jgi:hypothetical protein
MPGFESFSSSQAVKTKELAGLPFVIREQTGLRREDRRPPFDQLGISVPRFSHLGQSGELSLSFFNNRLEAVLFYPADPDAYLRTLRAAGIPLTGGKDLELPPFTRLRTGVDYQHRTYVVWEDVRLTEESDRWIERYA